MLRIFKQIVLLIIEFCFKLAAPLAAIVSLAAGGGFFSKFLSGFRSLPRAIREIVWWVQHIPEIGKIVEDYNTLTAASFNAKYGSGAINYVMAYFNEGLTYLQQVYQNLAEQPVVTVLAAGSVFLSLYLLGRLVRFIRQRGQGSVITKFERRTGHRIFNTREGNTERYGQDKRL